MGVSQHEKWQGANVSCLNKMETNFSMRNLSLASANVASIYTGGVKNEST